MVDINILAKNEEELEVLLQTIKYTVKILVRNMGLTNARWL